MKINVRMNLFKGIKEYLNKNNIRKRLIFYFVITTLFMGAANVYSFHNINKILGQVSNTFEGNVELNNLQDRLCKLQQVLENYVSSKSSTSLDEYYKFYNELKIDTEQLQIDYSNTERAMVIEDIKNMISSYLEETDASVNAKRGRLLQQYLVHYDDSMEIYGYINNYIDKLNNILFLQNTGRYMTLQNNFYLVEIINVGIVVAVAIFNLLLIIWFTFRLTKPITNLSTIANEITHGNFDVPDILVESDDETGKMALAFNRMKNSIRQYINEIKEKAELERVLKERDLENLKIKSDLKEAELHALQAQINPHFLFNTLSTGAQLAMFEDAERTCTFIEHAAELFRYNLRNLDKPVTIMDEVTNVKNYIYLLQVRYAEKIKFIVNIDESVADLKIPCMIVQPIVENAFIHGLTGMEYEGDISITVKNEDEFATISVKDNGSGMPVELIKDILSGEFSGSGDNKKINKGHASGIGLKNIISRLKIFYNFDDVMEIISQPMQGSEFILRIPIVKEED